jgi:peroxidase
MIRSRYSRANSEYVSDGPSFNLRNAYFRANFLYDQCEGGLESLVRGLLRDPIMKIDRHFSSDISQHLFETHDSLGRPFHFDLVAVNIARGRDHGVPPYIKFREFCRLPALRTWTQLKQAIPDETIQLFKSTYRFVDDIDLFTGAVAETRLPDALVGPTLACLLGHHFKDIKYADRFWYETNAPPARFTTRNFF